MFTVTYITHCRILRSISHPKWETAFDVFWALRAAGYAVRIWDKNRNLAM
jgi:hypothetical protein